MKVCRKSDDTAHTPLAIKETSTSECNQHPPLKQEKDGWGKDEGKEKVMEDEMPLGYSSMD